MNTAADLAVKGVFVFFALLAVFGAVLAVHSSRVIRGVSGLAICSVGLAGLFYFLRSPFVALMEILIYIGAVCVTIVFAVMLAEPDETVADERRDAARPGAALWTGAAALAALSLFAGLWLLAARHPWAAPAERVNDGSVRELGIALLGRYGLAFEMISLLLLVAILGALAVARAGRRSAQ